MSVARAQRVIDSSEYIEWIAFFSMEAKKSGVSPKKKKKVMSPTETHNVFKMFKAAHKAAHPGMYLNG